MATEALTLGKAAKQLLYLAVSAGLLLLLLYFYRLHHPAIKHTIDPGIANVIATDVHVTQFTEQGQLLYQFSSPQVWHYDRQNRTTFTKPVGLYYSTTQEPWTLIADNGEALDGDTVVTLNGNVQLTQPAGPHNTATTLTTSTVTLYPPKNTAQNAVLTHVERPDVSLSAVGFKADLNRNQVVLLSQAQARFRSPS